jgi:Protein of unknown function (DUF2844)
MANMKITWTKAKHVVLSFAVVGAALTYSSSAHAALDEVLASSSKEVSVEPVAGQSLRVRTRGVVKEFAGTDGKVFAAIWRGNAAPDLHTLLGAHYASYETALNARRKGGHNHLFLTTPEITINVISHNRMIAGSVYLTRGLPKGVTVDALR